MVLVLACLCVCVWVCVHACVCVCVCVYVCVRQKGLTWVSTVGGPWVSGESACNAHTQTYISIYLYIYIDIYVDRQTGTPTSGEGVLREGGGLGKGATAI